MAIYETIQLAEGTGVEVAVPGAGASDADFAEAIVSALADADWPTVAIRDGVHDWLKGLTWTSKTNGKALEMLSRSLREFFHAPPAPSFAPIDGSPQIRFESRSYSAGADSNDEAVTADDRLVSLIYPIVHGPTTGFTKEWGLLVRFTNFE